MKIQEYRFADIQAVSCSLLCQLYENIDGEDLACGAFGMGICCAMCLWRDVYMQVLYVCT